MNFLLIGFSKRKKTKRARQSGSSTGAKGYLMSLFRLNLRYTCLSCADLHQSANRTKYTGVKNFRILQKNKKYMESQAKF